LTDSQSVGIQREDSLDEIVELKGIVMELNSSDVANDFKDKAATHANQVTPGAILHQKA
jgi:hypothetical protein